MYKQMTLVLGTTLLGLVSAQHPQITAAPMTMAKRQGDPSNIELHQVYGAPIGVDTKYLSQQGSSTKWIGVNKDFLTELTTTATVNNVKTTTTVKQQLSVVTATAASKGVGIGDVTVLMADSIRSQVGTIIKGAAESCGAAAKLSKRDGMSCMINALQGAAQNDQTLALINPADWNSFVLELADNAPQILAAAVQVLKTQAQRNKFAILVAATTVSGVWAAGQVTKPQADVAHKYVFNGGLFGSSKDHPDGKSDRNQKTKTQKTATTTTASSCNPSATVNENSPACDDSDCKGDKKVCKAEGKNKNCPCVMWTKRMIEGLVDRDWANEQQKILKELENGLPTVTPPQCFRNTYGNGFDGKPKAEPSAFCHCSSAKSEGGMTSGNYPTMSGDGDKACAYPTMPTKPISITMRPQKTGVSVTSCKIESSHSLTPYCTCNDDKMHGQIITTYLGKVTTVCPDATATMTGIQGGTPTAEPSCYPTHGPPHTNPKLDQLIKLCGASKSTFGAVCATDQGGDRIKVGCPLKSQGKQSDPVQNNNYWAWFEKADNAPKDCKYLFRQAGSNINDDNEARPRVDALCIPAFEAIRDKCPWNGGEVKNQCGTFKYMSCPYVRDCRPGSPGG